MTTRHTFSGETDGRFYLTASGGVRGLLPTSKRWGVIPGFARNGDAVSANPPPMTPTRTRRIMGEMVGVRSECTSAGLLLVSQDGTSGETKPVRARLSETHLTPVSADLEGVGGVEKAPPKADFSPPLADQNPSKKPRTPTRTRPAGPNIRMTDSEYAHVQRMAASRGNRVGDWLRYLALKERNDLRFTRGHVGALKRAGRSLNEMVRQLHMDSDVSIGARQEGRLHYDDVEREVWKIQKTIQALPRRVWIAYGAVERGPGPRVHRGKVMCTREEHALLKDLAEAAGLSQSAFVRHVALGRPIGKKSAWRIIQQLERIANNLGQMRKVRKWPGVFGAEILQLEGHIGQRILEISSGKKRKGAG